MKLPCLNGSVRSDGCRTQGPWSVEEGQARLGPQIQLFEHVKSKRYINTAIDCGYPMASIAAIAIGHG